MPTNIWGQMVSREANQSETVYVHLCTYFSGLVCCAHGDVTLPGVTTVTFEEAYLTRTAMSTSKSALAVVADFKIVCLNPVLRRDEVVVFNAFCLKL
jgi:hypothetical protein